MCHSFACIVWCRFCRFSGLLPHQVRPDGLPFHPTLMPPPDGLFSVKIFGMMACKAFFLAFWRSECMQLNVLPEDLNEMICWRHWERLIILLLNSHSCLIDVFCLSLHRHLGSMCLAPAGMRPGAPQGLAGIGASSARIFGFLKVLYYV